MTVGALLSQISSTELAEWNAFYRLKNAERDEAEKRARLTQRATGNLPSTKRRRR